MAHPFFNMKSNLESAETRDKQKGYLSCSFMVLAFILPLVGFAYGTSQYDVTTGATIAAGVFVLLMLGAIVIALTIEHISWLFTFLPLLSSFIYSIAPDFVPGPVEDLIVLAVGAFFTLVLIVKKVAPSYVLLAVLVAGVYAWFGREWFPGFVDELMLFAFVLLLGFFVDRNTRQETLSEE